MADHPMHSAGENLAIERVTPNEPGALKVVLPDVDADRRLPLANSAHGENISPALSWTGMPEAEAYAVIMQGPDAERDAPFLHWMVWNIPGDAEGLTAGAGGRLPPDLAQGVQGCNDAGERGYTGPRPREGRAHHYHFQVFALDERLPDDPDLSFGEVMNMLKAHTLRHGEAIASFERQDRSDAPARAWNTISYR